MTSRIGLTMLACVAAVPVQGGVLRVPSEYATINAALDAASSGDSVMVAPGTYDQYETRLLGDGIWFSSVAFLRGDVSLVSEGGAAATILRMDSTVGGPVLMRAYGETGTSLVQGFTVTGTVVHLEGFACTFGGRWIIRDCVFRDIGTGASDEGAAGTVKADLEVYGCRFENINGSGGSAINQTSSTLILEDSEFLDCRSGAIELRYDSAFPHETGLTMRRCRFVGNVKTTGVGGGISVANYTSSEIEDCWFEGNVAVGGGGASCGGALSDVAIRRCTFLNNTGGDVGGGGLYFTGQSLTVDGNTFRGNAVTVNWFDGGSAAVIRGGGPRTFRNNVIAASTGDQAVRIGATVLDEGCNVFWQNPLGNTSGFTPSATDLEADPRFCDPAANDFHVGVGSPCIPGSGHPLCTELIGAWGEGCGTVAIPPTTWGKVKGGFRTEVRP